MANHSNEMLKEFDNLITEAKEEEFSNPLAPASYPQYGTELDVKYCSFYLKTGACRFGDRCSRHHMKPPASDTILLPAMFHHISLGEDFTNDLDIDSCLEHEDVDTNKSFTDFFWDVFPEFQAVGHVTMFKVCCNHEPHLRGNVYVQYKEEREAIQAYAKFNGRFYASRQISCEFVKIEKWKSAICGQFHRNRCPKGKNCNFLHVFKNPGGLFMVHGSETLAPSRAALSVAGEQAMRDLHSHPVVRAARARQKGLPAASAPSLPPHSPQQDRAHTSRERFSKETSRERSAERRQRDRLPAQRRPSDDRSPAQRRSSDDRSPAQRRPSDEKSRDRSRSPIERHSKGRVVSRGRERSDHYRRR